MSTVGIDVGGTHTDIVLVGDGGELLWADKVPSRPSEPALAISEALRRLPPGQSVSLCVNGTTVGINAILQKTLPRVGLITTKGFCDLLYIRRETKANIYDFQWRKPPPLIRRHLTFEVDERVAASGEVIVPVQDLDPMVTWVSEQQLHNVAVCLLHAYRNPSHEQKVRDALKEALPEVEVTLSSDVWPEWREFERTYNTALNAALKPVVNRYVVDLMRAVGEELEHDNVRLMHADGGILAPSEIMERPVLTLLSGTVAGALAGAHVAARTGHRHAVSLDMGGTSTDLSFAENGRVRRSGELEIEWEGTLGFAGVDVVSIGAGGGSIVWCDEAGGLHLGPQSAGADPGPAAAGRGGAAPTLTDAYLLLGYLGPAPVIAGRNLDPAKAERAFTEVGEASGLSPERTFLGAFEIATAHLANGVRRTTIERGVDPRSCVLICFGGAGPLHAAQLVKEVGLAEAVIPPRPGNGSALGLLLAPVKHSVSQTYFASLAELDRAAFTDATRDLREKAVRALPAGGSDQRMEVQWYLSLRYRGQTRELALPVDDERIVELDAGTVEGLAESFHTRHEREYTFSAPDEPIDLVSIRCDATIPTSPGDAFGVLASQQRRLIGDGSSTRATYAGLDGSLRELDTAVLVRDDLHPGSVVTGPAIVLDVGSTVLVPPDFIVRADDAGNLIITEAA